MSDEKAAILDAINARIAVMANGKPVQIDPSKVDEAKRILRAKFEEMELANIEAAAQDIEAAEQRQQFGSFS